MKLANRIKRYRAIEKYRKRPLIVYATSTRIGVPAKMAGDTVREFVDQIDAIHDGTDVDILIHSTGGDALAAWKLMSLLRERFDSIAVLVPYMAFSAATIFALGADEIVMHPHASLGPIDPQITIKTADGNERRFSFEDLGAFLRFLSEEVGVKEQAYVSTIMEKLFSVVDPLHVGGAKRASELSAQVGERLLATHMNESEEPGRARGIAEELNKSFFSHGDAVSRTRARELQLKITADNPKLEDLIWKAYLSLESYMELRSKFHPLQYFLAHGGEAALKPKAPLEVPPNAPPQLINNLWQNVATEALQNLSRPAIEVEYHLINAVVESLRVQAEFRTIGKINAARIAGGDIQLAVTDHQSGWRKVDNKESDDEEIAKDREEATDA